MRGFTLIEFLIVLVISGMIVLIAWPVVFFYVEQIQKENFYSTAIAIGKTAEGKCLSNQLNNLDEEIWVVFENGKMRGNIISYDTQSILKGQLKVASDCQLSMAIHDGNFCAQKRFADEQIIISARPKENCRIETSAILDVDQVNYLIAQGYVPIANTQELSQIGTNGRQLFGENTIWEDEYVGGLDQKYVQVAHIVVVEDEHLSPIGTIEQPFEGVFDGNDLYIYGLKITGEQYGGLFGVAQNAEIINVNLYDIQMNNSQIMGGVVGLNKNSLIKNVNVIGEIKGEEVVGCLVGENKGEIRKSYGNCMSYSNQETVVGGLVGVNKGEIIQSHASGAIINGKISGGLVGNIENGKIENSYSTTAVNGRIMVGGMAGQMVGSSEVKNCYSMGKVLLQNEEGDVGGLIGKKNSGRVINSYYNQTITEMSDLGKGKPQTNEQMLNAKNYHNWDFNQVWQIHRDYNDGFPFLRLND